VNALQGLIRLYRWQLDERRRRLADLEGLAAQLEDERRRLAAEDAHEQAVASASTEAAFAYGGYAHRLIERRSKLAQSQAEAAAQIVQARTALAEAFEEVKRYEIIAASRLRQKQLRQGRRQQRALDELGGEGFRRRGRGKP
jgi:flagellar protein FliJ